MAGLGSIHTLANANEKAHCVQVTWTARGFELQVVGKPVEMSRCTSTSRLLRYGIRNSAIFSRSEHKVMKSCTELSVSEGIVEGSSSSSQMDLGWSSRGSPSMTNPRIGAKSAPILRLVILERTPPVTSAPDLTSSHQHWRLDMGHRRWSIQFSVTLR